MVDSAWVGKHSPCWSFIKHLLLSRQAVRCTRVLAEDPNIFRGTLKILICRSNKVVMACFTEEADPKIPFYIQAWHLPTRDFKSRKRVTGNVWTTVNEWSERIVHIIHSTVLFKRTLNHNRSFKARVRGTTQLQEKQGGKTAATRSETSKSNEQLLDKSRLVKITSKFVTSCDTWCCASVLRRGRANEPQQKK